MDSAIMHGLMISNHSASFICFAIVIVPSSFVDLICEENFNWKLETSPLSVLLHADFEIVNPIDGFLNEPS